MRHQRRQHHRSTASQNSRLLKPGGSAALSQNGDRKCCFLLLVLFAVLYVCMYACMYVTHTHRYTGDIRIYLIRINASLSQFPHGYTTYAHEERAYEHGAEPRSTSQDMYDIMCMIKCVIDHIQHRVHEQVNEWPVFLLLPRWLSWANPGNKGRKTNDASRAVAEKPNHVWP